MVARALPMVNLGRNWNEFRPSMSFDVFSLALAVALHIPLLYMKLDHVAHHVDDNKNRLVSVDVINEVPKPEVEAPPAPPKVKEPSRFQKLFHLARREPPPPPPPPKAVEPPKPVDVPKPIALQPKPDLAAKLAPKLNTKLNFKTQADPKLVEDKKLAMAGTIGITPLSAKKVGVVDPKVAAKEDRGSFKIAANDSIKEIGGPKLADASGPQIALPMGHGASSEKLSAALPQKSDRGRIGAIPGAPLAEGPKLGLRDSIIARDAAPIGGKIGGETGGVPGGMVGGTGTKQDLGHFNAGREGGIAGATGTGLAGAGHLPLPAAAPRARGKKSMFSITGPLKDRGVLRQVTPEYPAWAQAQGIEASVILEFTVAPDGSVKNNVVVRRTSGYPKLDDTAVRALRQWKFVPLPDGQNRDEVGLITFNYSLS